MSRQSVSPTPRPSTSLSSPPSQSEPALSSPSTSTSGAEPSTSTQAKATRLTPFASRKRKAGGGGGDAVELAILESLRHVWDREQPTHSGEEDEDGLYGRQLAAKLRRFPSQQKAIAKLRIQQVLTDIEFGSTYSEQAYEF